MTGQGQPSPVRRARSATVVSRSGSVGGPDIAARAVGPEAECSEEQPHLKSVLHFVFQTRTESAKAGEDFQVERGPGCEGGLRAALAPLFVRQRRRIRVGSLGVDAASTKDQS